MSGIGLYQKYEVTRTDGRSQRGEKHYSCTYFVIDLEHDPHARAALLAYAKACEGDLPELAADLRAIFRVPRLRPCGCREASCPHSLGRAFTPSGPSEAADQVIASNERKRKQAR